MKPTITRYDAASRYLHWLTAALLAAQFVVALTMPDITRNTPAIGLVAWHLSLGVTILGLTAIRLVWARYRSTPAKGMKSIFHTFAAIAHKGLYALLVLVPVLGWINASARGYGLKLLGLVPLPALSTQGSSFGHAMGDVHSLLAYVLLGAIGLHICAALYHHWVLRDGTLHKMLPVQNQPEPSTSR
ncbi:cytochrome b [Pandoraea terrigena]|uniref:Cytochrome b561 n=1 Tax=Pandoraea terrigena TaxID=2508292 RepID=A0A5E4RDE2_9BURK|nr:cytochrome b [Pandoraea terrigena]VVD61396.1 Cytochrome b561 [Pandoraea terrigena]